MELERIKEEAIETAMDFYHYYKADSRAYKEYKFYGEECISEIMRATTEGAVYRALTNARQKGMKVARENKKANQNFFWRVA